MAHTEMIECPGCGYKHFSPEVDDLRCTINELSAALEGIASQQDMTLIAPSEGVIFDKGHQLGANKAFNQMADIARAAIAKAKGLGNVQ